MATFNPMEVHIVENGQTVITLSHPYEMGKNAVSIFLNGMIVIPGQDYIELDSYSIEFQYQLSSADIVITQQAVYFDDRYVELISDNRGLFQKYGEKERLLPNQKYTAVLRYGEQTFQTEFYTKMSPVFSSIAVIRNDMGEALDAFDTHKLMLQIYLNSILALNIAGEEQLAAINEALATDAQLPYYAKQYVRYRTELDMLMAIYFALSSRSGTSTRKQLGELTIDRQNKFVGYMNVEPMINDLKAKVAEWERILRGKTTSSPFRSAVRGGTNFEYPLTTPRRGNWGG